MLFCLVFSFFFVCRELFNLEAKTFLLPYHQTVLTFSAVQQGEGVTRTCPSVAVLVGAPRKQRATEQTKDFLRALLPSTSLLGRKKNNKNGHECFSDKDAAPRPRPSTPSAPPPHP